jgi:putative oxidoreductase
MNRDTTLLVLRLLAGGVFVVFGVAKFVNHASELASFRSYGLPAPTALVIAIGVIEIVGGALLIAGRYVKPAAVVLTGDMIGAILVSGVAKGEVVSLTFAPAELLIMLVLLRCGPGRHTIGLQGPIGAGAEVEP